MTYLEVRAATVSEIEAFVGAVNPSYYIAKIDGEAVAIGHILELDGRRWASLMVKPDAAKRGSGIVRCTRRILDSYPRPLYALCQAFPQSPRLLAACGFRETDENVAGAKVWVKD